MEGARGVVLCTYGLGNFPVDWEDLLDILKEKISENVVVCVTSQCRKGMVKDEYEAGNKLEKQGAIFCTDMTLESTVCKLAYLLEKNKN